VGLLLEEAAHPFGNGFIEDMVVERMKKAFPMCSAVQEIGDLIPEFRKMATEAGRNPDEIAITVWFPRRELDLMKRYADLGVERVVFNLESEAAEKVVPVIDEIAEFMRKANA